MIRKRTLSGYVTIGLLVLIILSPIFNEIIIVKAESQSLPDDATPLQSGIYEALKAANEAGETVPNAEYLSYENGTTLTILTYENGTQRHFIETFIVESVNINISPNDPIFLPIDTTDNEATEYLTKYQDILLGFTFQIPNLNWDFEIRDPLLNLLLAEGGYNIDIGFGLRLPVQNTLEYPEIMVINHVYTLYTSLTGLDWSASDYADVGLYPDENEFLCRFLVNIWLNVIGIEVFSVDIDFDESRSFTTPLGVGETFPIPSIPIPLNPIIGYVIGNDLSSYLILTLEIDPNIGSDKITANWKAENGALGGGSLLWSYNNERLNFDIQTQNIVAEAKITLSDFRYWFTQFVINFNLIIDFQGILSSLSDRELQVFTLDLSDIIGSMDLSVGVHKYTVGTVIVNIFMVIPEVPFGTLSIVILSLISLVTYTRATGMRARESSSRTT